MDVLSLGELSCSACCRLEHISTSLPIARTHAQLLHRKASAWAGRIGVQRAEVAVIRVQKGLFLPKGWGLFLSSTTAGLHGFPGETAPGISDFPSGKEQESETGSSPFVCWGWVGDEPGTTFSRCGGGGMLRGQQHQLVCRRICPQIRQGSPKGHRVQPGTPSP